MSPDGQTPIVTAPDAIQVTPALERRGRMWLLWSFLLCPCHLPLSLAALAAVFGGTAFGAALRDHAWLAATVITLTWAAGTGYGLWLIRRSQRSDGSCGIDGGR